MKLSYLGLFLFGSALTFPLKSAQFSILADLIGYLVFGLLFLSFLICIDFTIKIMNQTGRKDLKHISHIPAISAIAAMGTLIPIKSLIYGDFLSQQACFVLCVFHLGFSLVLYFLSWEKK